MWSRILRFGLLWFAGVCYMADSEWDKKWQDMCPAMLAHTFTGSAPVGNLSAGVYKKILAVDDLEMCVSDCCTKDYCNVALMYNKTCYQVRCASTRLCLPLYRRLEGEDPPVMVLVKPLEEDESWSSFFDQNNNIVASSAVVSRSEPEIPFLGESCIVSSDCSSANEVCIKSSKSNGRIGLCKCVPGFVKDSNGACVFHQELIDNDHSVPILKASTKQLFVNAVSKELRLPENEVSLSAFAVPAEQPNEHYNYAWSLLNAPDGHTGTMTDQNKNTVKLSKLSEGFYQFKVTVTGLNSYGNAYANVSVLPPKRVNQAPKAVILPAEQIVRLPNTGAVLDGSASKDDDKVISFHWELQQGPIGYQANLEDLPTLQLDNLIAGNYTFKLTVTDSDNVSNTTVANITVLNLIDYPPTANAGRDVIIYLPENTVTLNGNLSTDDRGIASWEWTKSPSDENKAVDMQNTRTPYLQLSNLEEGMYTFVLKVTDNSEQSSTADVRVFVKPPTNQPPTADAGDDVTIALPKTNTVLNGSRSKDDIKITSYQWEQVEGPTKAILSSDNESATNVTKLTKGEYVFKLTVTDDHNNKNSDTVQVKVTQNHNASPMANAGGDQTVVAPITALVINGSQSSDDLGIRHWFWSRDPTSLAMGNIVEDTDTQPILMLTDVVPGRYVFKLKVTDDQGLSSEDSVSVIVKPDPELLNLVELTLNIGAHLLTESQKDSLVVKLQMLLRDEARIMVRNLRIEPRTGRVVVVFYVEKRDDGTTVSGPEVVDKLKEKLRQDSGILQLSVASVETAVCQNNCSGHGTCDQETRQCLCEAFWMQNLIEQYFRNGEYNCEWSILYFIIALLLLTICWIGLSWTLICFFQRICTGKRRSLRSKKKPARYSLLPPEADDESTTFSAQKMVLSDSDSDSDVMFDKFKSKPNGQIFKNSKNRNFLKKPGKVKT